MARPLRASLIIPTFDRHRVLCDTLRMTVRQDYGNYEVIVVDQTPTASDELNAILCNLNGKVKYIRLQPPNLPAARNRGALDATGDILVFIDDDVVIESTYLSDHVKHYCDDRVGGVSGLTLHGKDDGSQALFNYGQLCAGGKTLRAGEVAKATALIGGNTSYRRRAFIEAGLSDERFYGSATAEDIDLSWRVKRCGYDLLLDTNIRMLHLALQDGGCGNRNRDPVIKKEVERQQKELWLYCVLKHRRSLTHTGSGAVWREIWRCYRDVALNR